MIEEEIYLNQLVTNEAWIVFAQDMVFGLSFYFFLGVFVYYKYKRHQELVEMQEEELMLQHCQWQNQEDESLMLYK